MISTDTSITNYLPYLLGAVVAEAWFPDPDTDLIEVMVNRYNVSTFESKDHDIDLHSMTVTAVKVIMNSERRDHLRSRIVSMADNPSGVYLQSVYDFLQKARHGVVSYDLAQKMLPSYHGLDKEGSELVRS